MISVNVTFESNNIIALEKEEETAPSLRKLIELHHSGAIVIRVTAISASEWQNGSKKPRNLKEFRQRLENVGLGQMRLLHPIAYFDITFYNASLYSGPRMTFLEREIHQILKPNIPFHIRELENLTAKENEGERKRAWLNAKCDVQAFWSHVWHGGGLFVSNDAIFHKSRKPDLVLLAGGDIVRPTEAIARIQLGPVFGVPPHIQEFIHHREQKIEIASIPPEFSHFWEGYNKRAKKPTQ